MPQIVVSIVTENTMLTVDVSSYKEKSIRIGLQNPRSDDIWTMLICIGMVIGILNEREEKRKGKKKKRKRNDDESYSTFFQ